MFLEQQNNYEIGRNLPISHQQPKSTNTVYSLVSLQCLFRNIFVLFFPDYKKNTCL